MDLQSTVVGFGFGMLSALVIVRVTEHLRFQRALSDKVFVPLHEQLTRIQSWVEKRLRSKEVPIWKQLEASALTHKIPRRTRTRMQGLYEEKLPQYHEASISAERQWEAIAARWNAQYGVPPPSGCRVRHFDWWSFLLAENCDESAIPAELGENEVVDIRGEAYVSPGRLAYLHTTVDQFFRDRWSEVRDDPTFVHFRTVRRETLDEIEQSMKHLARHIKP